MTDGPTVGECAREAFSNAPSLPEALEEITEFTGSRFAGNAEVSVIAWDWKARKFTDSRNSISSEAPGHAARRVRAREGASRWIVDHRLPLSVPDIDKDPFGANEILKEAGIERYYGIPLVHLDRVWGILYAMGRNRRDFRSTERRLMREVGDAAAETLARVGTSEE